MSDGYPHRRHNVPAIILSIVLVLVVLVGGFFLWGRDLIVQKVTEGLVTTELDKVKAGDVSDLVEATQGRTTFFDDYGIDETAFLQSYAQGLDYRLGDVVVKGDFIDIECDLHIKDFGTIAAGTTSRMFSSDAMSSALGAEKVDLAAGLGTALMESTDACDQYMDRTVHVRMVREDGEWKMDNASDVVAELVVGDDAGDSAARALQGFTDMLDQMSTGMNTLLHSLESLFPSTSGTGTSTTAKV